MRTLMVVLSLVAGLAPAFAGDEAGAPYTGPVQDRSRICMMQDSVQPKPGLAHEYEGKTYWLCCQMCVQSFSADPDRFAHATDPVDGAVVDKATAPAYAVRDKAFYFSSKKNLETFAKDPARFMHGG